MKPQITEKITWWYCRTTAGDEFFPCRDVSENDLDDCTEGKILEVDVVGGYGARLSAPGYLDSTPWIVHDDPVESLHCLLLSTSGHDREIERLIGQLDD